MTNVDRAAALLPQGLLLKFLGRAELSRLRLRAEAALNEAERRGWANARAQQVINKTRNAT